MDRILRFICSCLVVFPLVVLSQKDTQEAKNYGFECVNDICHSSLTVLEGPLNFILLTSVGHAVGGGEARVSGPGLMTIRDINADCGCSLVIDYQDREPKTIDCKQSGELLNTPIDFPEGWTTLKFNAPEEEKQCFQVRLEITATLQQHVEDVAELMAVDDEVVKDVGEQMANGTTASSSFSSTVPCEVGTYNLDLHVVHEVPSAAHFKEAQLWISHLRKLFPQMRAGLSEFGGEGGCYGQIVRMQNVVEAKKGFVSAMENAKSASNESERSSPLAALMKAAESTKWASELNGGHVLRIILLDATSLPHDKSTHCVTATEEEVAQVIKEQAASVVFFVTEETEEAYAKFRSDFGIAGYIHKIKSGKSMLDINKLTESTSESLKKLCMKHHETHHRRTLFEVAC